MTKRAILYARVSSDDRGKEGRNLAGQLEMCRRYALERGYTIVAELAEDDRGASGAEIDLPQLNQARDLAAAGEYDVFVGREMDRLSRNLAKQLIVEQELKRNGVLIEYVLGEYADTPEGDLQKHVRAVVAEYERAKIAERNTRGKKQKARGGAVLVFGRPPYGYKVTDDGMLEAIEPEAGIVRLIFEWYTSGDGEGKPLPVRAIVRKLSEMGAPTAGDRADPGGVTKRQGRGKWCRSTVNRILSNETYAGAWHYNKRRRDGKTHRARSKEEWISVEVPAIVTREAWEVAQKRKKRNREQAKRNRKYEYLLSGLAACGECGATMYSLPSKGKLYYKCARSRGEVLGGKCNAKSFRADRVDAVVWSWVKSVLTDPAMLAEGLRVKQAEGEESNAPLKKRLDVLDDLLTENRRQLERLLDLYLSGDFDKTMLTERKTRLETTIGALERVRATMCAQIEAQTLTDDQIRDIRDFAAKVADGLSAAEGDIEKKRIVLDVLDVRAVLTVEDGQQVVYVHCLSFDEVMHLTSC